MINDIDVKKEFDNLESIFSSSSKEKPLSPFQAQIHSGVTPKAWKNQTYPAGCKRHKLVFNTCNIIPRYCFDCYKIEIQPRTVIELFNLLILLKIINLKDNNTSKCFLRPRKDIATHYSGLIYFQGLIDVKQSFKYIKSILTSEIAPEIPIFIKRGCSEFGKAYPRYAELNENNQPVLKYNKKWSKREDSFDKNNLAGNIEPIKSDTFSAGFSKQDFLVMRAWLSYAKNYW